MEILLLLVSSILVNNFVMSKFLGCCPFLGVSKKVDTAVGMGMAVTFVMAVASLATYLVQKYLLDPFGLGYMQTIAFILVIAVLVQIIEMVIKKISMPLYQALGVYLPLITTNCAVLGVCLLNIGDSITIGGQLVEYDLLFSVLNGVFGALGFLLAIVLMAGVRERLETSKVPNCLKGFSSSLIIAGLMSVAFMGFAGLGS